MKVKFSSHGGFTLVETMVAMFIATIFAMSLLSTVVFAKVQMESARCRLNATVIATELVETMKSVTFDELKTNLGNSVYTNGTTQVANRSYEWSRNHTSSTDSVTVEVFVSWKILSNTQSVRTVSYINRYGTNPKNLL